MEDRSITLTIDAAREYYFSGNDHLKFFALKFYTEKEILSITKNYIFDKYIGDIENNVIDQINNYHKLQIIAKYLNNGWKKTDNTSGYFWFYDYTDKKWKLTSHISVTYHGIIYYKNKQLAEKAWELGSEYYTK